VHVAITTTIKRYQTSNILHTAERGKTEDQKKQPPKTPERVIQPNSTKAIAIQHTAITHQPAPRVLARGPSSAFRGPSLSLFPPHLKSRKET